MAKPKKKPKQPDTIDTIEAKHEFSDPEKINLLNDLAQAHMEIEGLKAQAKHSSADWKNRIKAVENKIGDVTNKATSGFELRQVKCRVEFDARKGKKTYFELETDKKVETRDMQPSDYEVQLPLEGEPAKDEAETQDRTVSE